MYRLTDEQYNQVVAALRRNGVQYKRLAPELADHVATAVEQFVLTGLSFDKAVEQAIQTFGGSDGINQVQQQTFLVHQSLSGMFRVLQTALVVTYVMTLCGVLLKWIQIPGADELLILGLGFVSTISIAALFVRFDLADRTGWERVLTVLLRLLFAIAISCLYFGFLFRLLHFPGAAEMQVLGAIFMGLMLIMAMLNGSLVQQLVTANAKFFLRMWAIPTVLIVLLMTAYSLT